MGQEHLANPAMLARGYYSYSYCCCCWLAGWLAGWRWWRRGGRLCFPHNVKREADVAMYYCTVDAVLVWLACRKESCWGQAKEAGDHNMGKGSSLKRETHFAGD